MELILICLAILSIILLGCITILLCLVAKGINNAGEIMDDSFRWGGHEREDT